MTRICIVSSIVDIQKRVNNMVADNKLPNVDYLYITEYFNNDIPKRKENEFLVQDFSNKASFRWMLSWLKKFRNIDYVVSYDEFSVYWAAQIREELNIDGPKTSDIIHFRDKHSMKSYFGNGVYLPEAISLLDIKEQNININFPIIAKPRSLSGSVGVEIIKSNLALNDFIKKNNLEKSGYVDMKPDQYIFEEYIDGELYIVDFAIYKGKLSWKSFSKYNGEPLDFISGEPMEVFSIPLNEENLIWEKFIQSVSKKIKIDGVYHLEAFQRSENDDPIFLEIGFRPGGGPLVDMANILYGISIDCIHIQLQIGFFQGFQFKKNTNIHVSSIIFPRNYKNYDTTKVVTGHNFSEMENKLNNLVKYSLPAMGKKVGGEFFDYHDNLGCFIFSGSYRDTKQEIDYLKKNYEIEIG